MIKIELGKVQIESTDDAELLTEATLACHAAAHKISDKDKKRTYNGVMKDLESGALENNVTKIKPF